MSAIKLTRREFIRSTAASVAASAAGIQLTADAANINTEASSTELKWSKAACRFCGTGCGVTVAVKNNRVVATHGDPASEVNRGLNNNNRGRTTVVFQKNSESNNLTGQARISQRKRQKH